MCLFGSATDGQTNQAKPVSWQPVIGHQKEFVVFMPGGFKSIVDDNYKYFGNRKTGIVGVKRAVKAARLINGTLLLMTYYEASGRGLAENLSANNGLTLVGEETSGNFTIKRFAGKERSQFLKVHYFIGRDRLYEVKSYSREDRDPIAEAFFASVRLAEGNSYTAPNGEKGDSSTALPRLQEIAPQLAPDTVPIDDKVLDRGAIVLFQPPLRSTSDQGTLPQAGKVTATALLSASGTVTDVKTSGSAPLDLKQAFATTVKNIVFIPAEKDGKLVPILRTFSWEMTVEVRVMGPMRIQ